MKPPPPPAQSVLCEPSEDRSKPGLYITGTWYRWLIDQSQAQAATAAIKATINQTGQTAAITTTAALAALQTAGLYRCTWLVQVTKAAATSSSAQITLSWISGGVGQTKLGAAVTGNSTTSWDTGTVLIKADGLTDLNYAVSYASNAANTMEYSISLVIELLS